MSISVAILVTLLSVLMASGCSGGSSLREPSNEPFVHGALRVSSDGRFLVHEDGTPFPYFGDTAWQLFHRLDSTEVKYYLADRQAKGFTVIQACILAELNGLDTPNRNGDLPLFDNDPTRPNEAYFAWVNFVIQEAAAHGLYVGLLPTWGDKVNRKWGVGPEIFDEWNARKYGRFLGRRYREFPNIIWINGGDRPGGEKTIVWDALAEGICAEDSTHLMTYHPSGEASSGMWFHNRDWLDFNMFQSGHAQTDFAIYKRLLIPDYERNPVKPVLDGEPRYEDIPIRFKSENGRFTDTDVRRTLYWSLFSGACGYTYGANDIWQFYVPGRTSMCEARNHWKDALQLPGASQLIHARRLLENFGWCDRVPAPELLFGAPLQNDDVAVAVRGSDYALVYIPNGHPVEISLRKLPLKETLRFSWYDPRNGARYAMEQPDSENILRVVPPSSGRGQDWILIVEF